MRPDIGLLGEDIVLRPDIGLVFGLRLRELGFGFKVGLCVAKIKSYYVQFGVASAELNWGS
jgi:hypothetical protein